MKCDFYFVTCRYLIVKEDGTLENYGLNAGEYLCGIWNVPPVM